MSDTIGVLGQKYVDRKSNKTGTLLDRDVENKKLSFLGEDGVPFTVTFAAFKSNWRKVINETPKEEPEAESSYTDFEKADPGTEPAVEVKPVYPQPLPVMPEDEKIKNFVSDLVEARVASVDIIGDTTTIMADDVIICTIHKVEGGYKMIMLPDIFIFTDWHDTFKASEVHFNIKHGRHLGVLVDCVRASLGDILQFIKTAAVEINLYGYID